MSCLLGCGEPSAPRGGTGTCLPFIISISKPQRFPAVGADSVERSFSLSLLWMSSDVRLARCRWDSPRPFHFPSVGSLRPAELRVASCELGGSARRTNRSGSGGSSGGIGPHDHRAMSWSSPHSQVWCAFATMSSSVQAGPRSDEGSEFGLNEDEALLQSERPEGVCVRVSNARIGPGWGAAGAGHDHDEEDEDEDEDEISRTSDEDSLSEQECPDDLSSVVLTNLTCASTFHSMGETPTLYEFSCANSGDDSFGVRFYRST